MAAVLEPVSCVLDIFIPANKWSLDQVLLEQVTKRNVRLSVRFPLVFAMTGLWGFFFSIFSAVHRSKTKNTHPSALFVAQQRLIWLSFGSPL